MEVHSRVHARPGGTNAKLSRHLSEVWLKVHAALYDAEEIVDCVFLTQCRLLRHVRLNSTEKERCKRKVQALTEVGVALLYD